MFTEKFNYWTPIAILVVLVGVVGFIVYVMTPPAAGYAAGRGYQYTPSHHAGESRIKRFKREFSHRWKEKFSKKAY